VKPTQSQNSVSAIHDNSTHGSVVGFLTPKIKEDSQLSIVSAYIAIYSYEALKEKALEDGID
jgi:hypothetical protein